MGETLRQAIKKQYDLAKIVKPATIKEKDATGLRVKERGTSNRIFYCPHCKGPVVDSPQARRRHAQLQPRCAETMGY